jgi:hypothetical protein
LPFDCAATDTLIAETFRIVPPIYPVYEGRLPTDEQEKPAPCMVDHARNYVYNVAQQISAEKVLRVDASYDDYYGIVVRLTTDLKASKALELWLHLVKELKDKEHNVAIALNWLGKTDVPKHKLVDYFVKIMLASGMGPRALPDFDAVAAVRETRSE